jgi:hypothetical protein
MPDTSTTLPPALAAGNPEAVAALKKLTWSNAIAIASFAALALAEALPQFVDAAKAFIPPSFSWAVPLAVMLGNAVQGALVHFAKKDHIGAVDTALYKDAPSIQDAYK